MSRTWILSLGLAAAMSVIPGLASAQGRPEPRHDGPGFQPGQARPIQIGQQGRQEAPPASEGQHRSSRENDARYEALRHQEATKMNEHDRQEWEQLQARQRRVDDLKKKDAERERTRLERQRQARQQALAQHHNAPISPAAHEEYERYSQRKAALIRAKEVADAEGRADASRRSDELLAREEQRHSAWIAAHNS
jgi:hypothetical protein